MDSFGAGVIPLNNGADFWVESDGVPGLTTADHTHPFPAEVDAGLGWSRTYRLSPSRQWLYVFGNPSDTFGVRIYLYKIPTADGAPLEPVITGSTFPGIAFEGFYDQGGASPQHLFFAVEFFVGGAQRIVWVDLDTGVTGFTHALTNIVESPLYFAPNGIAAFVHTGGSAPGLGTYHMVELCVDDLGTNINPSGFPWGDLPSPTADAYLVENSGTWEAHVWHGSTELGSVVLDDCSGAVVPDVGACCDNGNCIDNVTEDYCENQLSGTWQGTGSACANTTCPPALLPLLSANITGPLSAPAGSTLNYTVNVMNSGNTPATGLIVTAFLPSNMTFISADSGGVFEPNFRTLTWNVANLNDGVTGHYGMVIQADCSSQLAINNCTVEADNHGDVFGTGGTTQLIPLSTLPVNLTVTRIIPNGEPVAEGELVEFTFTITNPEPDQREIKFNSSLGHPLVIESFVDLAGGTETNNGAGFWWEGTIDPLQTINVVVRGEVPGCRTTGAMTSVLNDTWPIVVRNMCGQPLVTINPTINTLIAEKNALTYVEVLGTSPLEVIGQDVAGLLLGHSPALVRKGDSVTIAWSLVNNGNSTLAITNGSLSTSGFVPTSNPPFIGTPPAGAVWDASEGEVYYTGNLAPGDSLVIEVSMIYPENENCNLNIYGQLASADCPNLAQAVLTVGGVGQKFNEAHLVELNTWGKLLRQRPGIDTVPEEWLCMFVEYLSSLSANDDGSFWMAGLPTVRFDPVNLELAMLGYLPDLDIINLISVVEDSQAQILYVSGYEWINGSGRNRIRAVDMITDQVTDVYNEAATGFVMGAIRNMHLDPQGNLVLTSDYSGLFRMDPADSTTFEILSDSGLMTSYSGLDLNSSGDYVVADSGTMNGSTTTNLAIVDASTGTHQVLADLSNLMPVTFSGISSVAAGDDSLYYVSVPNEAVYEIDLSGSFPVVSNVMPVNFMEYSGLVFVPESNPLSGVGDDDVAFEIPSRTSFAGAAPNPFNPRTTLRFELATGSPTTLAVYDLQGRLVQTLINENLEAGYHEVLWNGDDRSGRSVASGLYLARLQSGGLNKTVKLVLTR